MSSQKRPAVQAAGETTKRSIELLIPINLRVPRQIAMSECAGRALTLALSQGARESESVILMQACRVRAGSCLRRLSTR
jgi:hypothetical protein